MTWLADADGLYDPSQYNERLLLGLKGTIGEAEICILRSRLQGALGNKAERGEVLNHPPIGYARTLAGDFVIDPDEQLQAVVRLPRGRIGPDQRIPVLDRRELAGPRLRIPRLAQPPKLDGDLSEFGPASAAAFALKPGAQGTARLMYDADTLYAAFDVEDDSPWRNSGGDLSTLFKTGDGVDIWLGPGAGKRPPGLGDVRVLIAPVDGQPTAVLFEQRVARDVRPVPFRNPAGEVTLDRISPLREARIAVATRPGGYRLEAAIPWKSLGHSPEAGRLGLDLDVNFRDPAGQRNTARLHWGRHGAATVYDLPTEARFEPELWGEAIFER